MIQLPLVLFSLGLGALYLGERTLEGVARTAALALAAAMLTATFALALARVAQARGTRRQAHRIALGAYATAFLGLSAYGLWAYAPPGSLSPAARAALTAAWPALLTFGALPAAATDLAIGSMARAPVLEPWRVRLAARSARILTLGLVAFAAANFAAAGTARKVDLSYFKTTQVGSATRALVQDLTQPVTLTLFFPPGNEVLVQARGYVDALAAESPSVTVEVLDQALAPQRARALQVRGNGYLVVQSDHAHEALRLDLDAEAARGALRSLDREVHQRLLKVLRPERVAYLTTGHHELDLAPAGDDARPALAGLKALLTAQNIAVRRLGLAEGLGDEVPKDASLVIVAGPTEALSAMEQAALSRYLAGGGRAILALDPEHGPQEAALLGPLGVTVGRSLVASDRFRVRVPGRGESPYDIVTARAGGHPIAATLANNSGRLGLALLGAGAVAAASPAPAGVRVTLAIHAMPGSYEDLDGNGQQDPAAEPATPIGLVAAVEGAQAPAADAAPPPSAGAPAPMRAVVVGDADWMADGVIQNPGNAYLMVDILRWLIGEEATGLAVESEEDVPVVHRKQDDVVWFYGVSVLMPLLVLILGIAFGRRGLAAGGSPKPGPGPTPTTEA